MANGLFDFYHSYAVDFIGACRHSEGAATHYALDSSRLADTMWIMLGSVADAAEFRAIIDDYFRVNEDTLRAAFDDEDNVTKVAEQLRLLDDHVHARMSLEPAPLLPSHTLEEAHRSALALARELGKGSQRSSSTASLPTASPETDTSTPSPA